MPRYHGYGLIEPDERSAFADNRGGTAKIFVPETVSVSGFFCFWHTAKSKSENTPNEKTININDNF